MIPVTVRETHRACQAHCARADMEGQGTFWDAAPMWKHLKAWRLFRDLSQERVAAELGKRHTTIGRWERGEMKLSTEDLEALARIYGATVHQVQMPPEAAELVSRLDRAQSIMDSLNPTDLERWLALGESLVRK